MGEQEKDILKQLGDGDRLNCLTRLVKILITTEDNGQQTHILTAIAKVCSFETDTMFRTFIEKLRKEEDYGTFDEV